MRRNSNEEGYLTVFSCTNDIGVVQSTVGPHDQPYCVVQSTVGPHDQPYCVVQSTVGPHDQPYCQENVVRENQYFNNNYQ